MKNLLSMMLLIASFVCFNSCSNDDETYVPQNVEFTLDYTFIESGSMSRTTGTEAYNNFYEKYIKTKQLTPTTYSLTFTNKETGATATINGFWKNKDAIRLPEGEYEITGTSAPANNSYISDSVFISFNETVYITQNMTSINLTAQYDSYLLMLENNNFSKAYYYYYYSTYSTGTTNMYQTDENYILFIKNLHGGTNYLKLTRNDGKESSIVLDNIPFEKGKYYYFNDMTNSFDIPKMETGN